MPSRGRVSPLLVRARHQRHAAALTDTVYVPGIGFCSAAGVCMRTETVVAQGSRSLMVMHLVSTEGATKLAFEVRDDERQALCLSGGMDVHDLMRMQLRLRDDTGRDYARLRTVHEGMAVGQHRFGFFRRTASFEPLPPDARRVTLDISGVLGEWNVSVELVPIAESGAPIRHTVDAGCEHEGITVRILGIAYLDAEMIVELDATAAPPVRAVRGIGAEGGRHGDDAVFLLDAEGRRYDELPSGDLWRLHRFGGRTLAAFARIADARDLTLFVPAVLVEEAGEVTVDVPLREPREERFGAYSLRILSAELGEMPTRPPTLDPPRPAVVVRVAPGAWHGHRRAMKPGRTLVDGAQRLGGWGWDPEPEATRLEIPLNSTETLAAVTLAGPIVRVRGPWEIRFRPPA